MSPWKSLLRAVRGAHPKDWAVVPIDNTLLADLDALAEQEQRPREAVARDLLIFALNLIEANKARLETWHNLSPREQQVAALICKNYSNSDIARQLVITPNTVKTHVSSILHKFGEPNRAALRAALLNWDFSAWE